MNPEHKEWPVEMTPAEFLEKIRWSIGTSTRFSTWEEIQKKKKEIQKLGIKTKEEYEEYQKQFSTTEKDDNITKEN